MANTVACVSNQRYAAHQHWYFLGSVMQNFSALSHRSNYAFKPTAGEVIRTN